MKIKENQIIDFVVGITINSGVLTLRTIDALFKRFSGDEK